MLLDIIDWQFAQRTAAVGAKVVARQRFRARRYLFTDEVVDQLGNLLRDFPNALLDNYQFALPPYPCTYVELSIVPLFRALNPGQIMEVMGGESEDDPAEQTDITIGYFIDDGVVYTLVQGRDKSIPPTLMPIYYVLDSPGVRPGFRPIIVRKTGDVDPDSWGNGLLAYMLGSTLMNPRSTMTDERANDILSRYRVYCDRAIQNTPQGEKLVKEMMVGATGDVRNILSLLLWLNQPGLYQIGQAPATRGWHHGKPRAYAAHHVVQLKKGLKLRTILRAFKPRRSPRRHEVSAFWRNYEKTICEHDWPIYADEKGHWHCKKCPQWRTRIPAHERGDASIGFVTKEYRAEA